MKKFTAFITFSLFVVFASCNDYDSVEENQTYNKKTNKPGDKTIVEIASAAGFTELIDVVLYVDEQEGTNLVEALSSKQKKVTVFAPSNEAFNTLYQTLESLGYENIITGEELGYEAIPSPILLAVLQYHLTAGRRGSNSVLPNGNNDRTIQTMFNNRSFSVDKNGNISDVGDLYDIAIDLPDNSASNGMVHGITGVLIPVTPAELFTLWPLPQ